MNYFDIGAIIIFRSARSIDSVGEIKIFPGDFNAMVHTDDNDNFNSVIVRYFVRSRLNIRRYI